MYAVSGIVERMVEVIIQLGLTITAYHYTIIKVIVSRRDIKGWCDLQR